MTSPTHLSMSHEGKEILRKIVEGLEGVTPGPWLEEGRYVFIDTRGQVCCGRGVEVGCPEGGSMLECCGNPDVEGDYHAIAEGGENNIPHIARCHPDAIWAISAYVAAVEKERDEALTWISEATKMITDVTGGGSELFVRKGDTFRADLQFCRNRIRERESAAHERFLSENKRRREIEAELSTARRTALLEAAGYHDEKVAEIWNADPEQMTDAEKTARGVAYSVHIMAADAIRKLAEDA